MNYQKLVDDYFKALKGLETDPEYRAYIEELSALVWPAVFTVLSNRMNVKVKFQSCKYCFVL